MKKDPNFEAIVAAAMADGLPGDEPGGAETADPRFAQFQKMADAMGPAHFEAPKHLIEAAKALMPIPERQRIWARLAGGSMALAGARSATADSFQLTFDADGARTRLMYERTAAGWEIAGQAPAGLTVERKGKRLRCDAEGRFVFSVKKLGDTGLTLLDDRREIWIPPADQVEADDTQRPD